MPRLILIEPDLADYWYEQKLLSDPDTMNYNAGYDVSYFGYYYDTGCIDFPKERWLDDYHKRKNNPQKYFALIKDLDLDKYIGYVNYHYNLDDNRYWCGIVIEGKYRGQGYAKEALKLLCRQAFEHGIDCLYDNFEKNRIAALRVFQEVGFKIIEEKLWLKFAKHVDGVVVSLHKKDFEEIIKKV
jgi:RimJ/RimL family protein N-acetyltransferase